MQNEIDDLAAQMVREIRLEIDKDGIAAVLYTARIERIARRYMEKASESKSRPEIDAAIERERFGKWWRYWNPTVPLPGANSYTFDAWMAAIRAERAGKDGR